jgi:hypothetical protein
LGYSLFDVDCVHAFSGDMSHETYQPLCKNRQLWSTTILDTFQTTSSITNVASCICCVRPVLKDDIGTRRLEMKNFFGDMLNLCSTEKGHMIYNAQCCILRDGAKTNEVFVCYICQPSWKKSVSQYGTPGQVVDVPYTFMVLSDNYMKNVEKKNDRTDKLSLLKYVLCCSSRVNIVREGQVVETIYHPLRTPDFVLLEQSILFFEYIFEYYSFNVREFNLCPFEMVNIADWHIAGFPLLMFNKKKSQDIRKAIRGIVGMHYCMMNKLSTKLELMHVNPPVTHICAACHEASRRTEKTGNGYDSFFLPEWMEIRRKLEHGVLFKINKKKVNFVLCKNCNEMSVVSFKYYREISKSFPRHFRQRNRQRYYARLIQSCESAAAAAAAASIDCTDEREAGLAAKTDALTDDIESDAEETMENEIRRAMQQCSHDDNDGKDIDSDNDDIASGPSPVSPVTESRVNLDLDDIGAVRKLSPHLDSTYVSSDSESMNDNLAHHSVSESDNDASEGNLSIDEESGDDRCTHSPTNFDMAPVDPAVAFLLSLKRKRLS